MTKITQLRKSSVKEFSTNLLSKNLQLLIAGNNISDSELARRVDISQSVLNRLKRGVEVNPTLDTLLKLSNYFTISIGELVGQEPLPQDPLSGKHQSFHHGWTRVPIISWNDLMKVEKKTLEINDNTRYTEIELLLDGFVFALIMQGSSMEPKFSAGTMLIFQDIRQAKDGDYVLIKSNETSCYSFKRFFIDGGVRFIASTNPTFNDFRQLNAKDKVLATMVQAKYNL